MLYGCVLRLLPSCRLLLLPGCHPVASTHHFLMASSPNRDAGRHLRYRRLLHFLGTTASVSPRHPDPVANRPIAPRRRLIPSHCCCHHPRLPHHGCRMLLRRSLLLPMRLMMLPSSAESL